MPLTYYCDPDNSTADRSSNWTRRAGVVDVEKDWGEDSICDSAAILATRLHLSMHPRGHLSHAGTELFREKV
jgi:hypothetical protein